MWTAYFWRSPTHTQFGAAVLAAMNSIPLDRSVRVGGHHLYADRFDRYVAALGWKFGWLEVEERRLIAREVKPGMVVIDVGANLGIHTLGLAQRVTRSGRVYALEPDPAMFGLLSRAVTNLPQVRPIEAAAAERSGTARLYVSDVNRGDNRIIPVGGETRRSIDVPVVALDELLAAEAAVDFVKLDVQGAELAVLAGMRETIKRSPGLQILIEVCPELLDDAGASAEDLFAFLRAERLHVHGVTPAGGHAPIDEQTACELAAARTYLNVLAFRG